MLQNKGANCRLHAHYLQNIIRICPTAAARSTFIEILIKIKHSFLCGL